MDKINNERLLEIPTRNNDKLTYKEVRFIDEYMSCGIAKEAYRRAFPDAKEENLSSGASALLRRKRVKDEIERRGQAMTDSSIMDAKEILQLYTDIARGKVLDQFGLEASLKDRLAAVKELAKWQIEMANKTQQDNTLTVKLVK